MCYMKSLAVFGMFCCLAGFSTGIAIAAEPAELVAWGDDFYGQTEIPASLSNVIAVVGGRAHTVALTEAGQVVGWGAYDAGGGIFPFSVPSNATNIIIVAAGGSHTLAVKSDGSLMTWGY